MSDALPKFDRSTIADALSSTRKSPEDLHHTPKHSNPTSTFIKPTCSADSSGTLRRSISVINSERLKRQEYVFAHWVFGKAR
ncbi:hypothetical protein PCASD_18952 [Puccinia coronata f. sp. avenae]|uniref:Uncharacterized protein n=1 Tax=Puccinia coronata f. sp. avenae TaxID=200324 RepID=A0A2N5S7Z4_9BASI|nr:hypothetical protein PCASD_18952 [Puccinia coronata f. sp. avenae]